jgi:hypothetical protein
MMIRIVKRSPCRRVLTLLQVAWLAACCSAANLAHGDAQRWATSVHLSGHSSGGVLSLGEACSVNSPYVVVTNEAGDKAQTVLRRLAEQLRAAEAAFAGNRIESVSDDRLVLYGSNPWMFGGTEAGFSIPAPVTSLSASFSEEGRTVILRWSNPPGGYECIHVVYKGSDDYPGLEALGRLGGIPGNATEFVHRPRDSSEPLLWSSDVDALVVGYTKDGTPSNATGIRFLNHVRQESLMNVPFTQGLAPGFQAWTDRASGETIKVEQGELSGVAPGTGAGRVRPKGFYQVVRGEGTFCGGVSRTFLGLTAGHAYRGSARINTLQAKAGAWSWSFHAAANSPGQNSLTPEEMSGSAELPGHAKGPTAGQIARYDSATATKGEWVLCSSGAEGPGKTTGDITVPEGCDSITLWLRLEGTNVADIACGLDSVALEDLGKH